MSTPRREGLFIDTGAFYARFNPRDENHEQAARVFDGIGDGDLVYAPLVTSHSIIGELATLLRRHTSHSRAVEALDAILHSESSFDIMAVDDETFRRAGSEFRRFDDQSISFVDHTSGVLAGDRDIAHVFTFDTSDFQTLGFTCVPDDV